MADAYKFSQFWQNKSFDNALRFLGENENGATMIACAIAVFKGIFRPVFTMMDKNTDPETKKYAAIREGLTEVAAFPIYAAIPAIIGATVHRFYKGNNEKNVKVNAKFIGLCAATLVIPLVCNAIQPPIMEALKKSSNAKKAKVGNDNTLAQPQSQPLQATFKGRVNYGMRIGG